MENLGVKLLSVKKTCGSAEEAFERFFADNPAYQVGKYLFIENDNSSAKKGSESSSAERIR